ncbi:MAG: succinyl-diaminopimelate desuccinylase [Candidatus Dormibacteraeota bacterium]|nr:succinyl-diaminopimelate desuccinylase [Candidatus Dormibacteraeota bacterium]
MTVDELALALVDIPSVSGEEQAITHWIGRRVAAMPHLEVLHSQPDALVFGRPGAADVLLAGHSDTVPEQGNLPGRRLDGHVHGLGASDMKGGLAVMLVLAAELGELPLVLNPLFVIFGGEELSRAENVLDGLFPVCPALLEAKLAVVMEPTGNQLEAGCLGNIKAELLFEGLAAHSARPWLGRNAIHEAVRGLRPLVDLEPEEVVLEGLTFREVLSVTEIEGGVANNVIPDRVICGLNYRYAGSRSPSQAEARLRELVGERGQLTVLGNAPAAPVPSGNPLLKRLRRAGNLEMEPKQAWTPVAQFAAQGLEAVNFGPGQPELAHKRDERISTAAMVSSLDVLRRFLCS